MEILKDINIYQFVRVAFLVVIGIPVVWFITRFIKKTLEKRVSAQLYRLITNIIFYLGLIIIIASLLKEFGFDVSALLGAAGVFGIAVGFAAKTTVANIISGIFLILERSVVVGDRISCDKSSGIVESIDLISVKLRTLDGELVRIPNEILVSQSMTNFSHYPNRRVTYKIEIQLDQDISSLLAFLQRILSEEPTILSSPESVILVKEFTQSSINIMLRFWIKQKDYNAIYLKLVEKIKQFGQEKNIWIGLTQE